MPKYRITAGVVLLPLLIAGAAVLFWRHLPYQNVAARQIRHALDGYGLKVNSLAVKQLDGNRAVIDNIRLGDNPALKIGHIAAEYRLQSLRSGKIDTITADHLEAEIYRHAGKWQVGGLEDFKMPEAPQKNAEPFFLFDIEKLRHRLPDRVILKESQFVLRMDKDVATVPFGFDLILEPAPAFTLKTQKFNVASKPYAANLSTAQLSGKLNAASREWTGKFSIPSVGINGLSRPIPPLSLKSEYRLSSAKLRAQLHIASADKSHRVEITVSLPLAKPMQGNLLVAYLGFPWGGGQVFVENMHLPLSMKQPISANIQLREVQLSSLLQDTGGGKIRASGRISGNLPVTYHPDGTVTLQEGGAEALEAGTLIVSPDLLPGENAQLAVARTMLQNFHYTKLKITISSPDGKTSAIHLALEGQNPEAAEKRPVKLNVNLTGDILPLIQQSLIPFNDLKQLLQTQEKP